MPRTNWILFVFTWTQAPIPYYSRSEYLMDHSNVIEISLAHTEHQERSQHMTASRLDFFSTFRMRTLATSPSPQD